MAGRPPSGSDLVLPGASTTRRRRIHLVHFFALALTAELLLALAALGANEGLVTLALFVEVLLVAVLLVQLTLLATRDRTFASLLGALLLVPLLRIVTLTTPLQPFTFVEWLAVVSIPLFLGAFAVMRAQGLRPRDVFLGVGVRAWIPVNVALIPVGLALGLLEYELVRPEPWIFSSRVEDLVFASAVALLATGFAEELIFRGLVLSRSALLMSRARAVVLVAIVSAALHVGSLSPFPVVLDFAAGLVFGYAVLRTRALWGSACAHGLINILAYVVLPMGA